MLFLLSRTQTGNQMYLSLRIMRDTTNSKLRIVRRVDAIVDSLGHKRKQVLCECECGTTFKVRLSSVKSGYTKSCGCMTSEWRKSAKIGEKNPLWKGENVQYGALHAWVSRNKPKPSLCEECNEAPPYDLANISQEYKRDIDDFEWICRVCHMTKDGRIEKLIKYKRYG